MDSLNTLLPSLIIFAPTIGAVLLVLIAVGRTVIGL